MSNYLQLFGRGFTCPICDHTDWCRYHDFGDGRMVVYCHRYTDAAKVGAAGTTYSGNDAYTSQGIFHLLEETPDGFGKFGNDAYVEKQTARKKIQSYKKKGSTLSNGSRKAMAEMIQKKKTLERVKTEKNQPADVVTLNKIYGVFLQQLQLEDWHRKELAEKDHWSPELFEQVRRWFPIVSLPPIDTEWSLKQPGRKNPSRKEILDVMQAEAGNTLKNVPGFYQKDGNWNFFGLSGYILPQYTIDGYLYRLRVRVDENVRLRMAKKVAEDAGKKEDDGFIQSEFRKLGKYNNFSSSNRENGCESGSELSCYGHWLQSEYLSGKRTRVVICEGEKKGIIGAVKMNLFHITLPGVSTYRILSEPIQCAPQSPLEGKNMYDCMKKLGVKRIAVANDMDMYDNENVMKATVGLLREIWQHGFVPELCQWNRQMGKGLDDILLAGAIPFFQEVEGIK